jgi:hypothetical protein
MRTSTAIAERHNVGPARPGRASDKRGVIAVAVPVGAISARASEIERLLDANDILPDDEAGYPMLLASLPSPSHFAHAIAELEDVLSRAATTPECQALLVMMFDTLGARVDAGARNRIGGYALALMNNGLDDDVPISATVLGLAIARQLKVAKRPPLPSTLLDECMSVRDKVEALMHRLQDSEGRSAELRQQLEWRISTVNDIDNESGDNAIPF